MSLNEQLKNDLVAAMKAQDKETLSVIRSIKGALQLESINSGKEIDDEMFISVVSKQIKMRKDSIAEFEKANRQDLVDSYQQEIDIMKKYMPQELSEEEVLKILDEAIKKVKPTSMAQMGLIMKEVSPKLKGRFDMSKVSNMIKEKLNF